MFVIGNAKHARRSAFPGVGRTFLVTAATLVLAAGTLSAAPGFRGWWGPAPAPAAAAVTVNPVAPALGCNAVSEGDAYLAGTESESPIAVGGDLSFGRDYRVRVHNDGSLPAPGESNPVALLVQGEVDFEDSDPQGVLSIPTGAYVRTGDLDNADVFTTDLNNASANTRITPEGAGYEGCPRVQLSTMQPADSVGPAPDLIDFEQAFAAFRTYSSGFALCSTTTTPTTPNGDPIDPDGIPAGADLHVSLTPGQQNVLNLTAEELNSLTQPTLDDPPTEDTPLIINVDTSGAGGDFTWEGPTGAGLSGSTAPYTLWNFSGARTVTIPVGTDSIEGTVYAPDAEVDHYTSANIEGTVVARVRPLRGGRARSRPCGRDRGHPSRSRTVTPVSVDPPQHRGPQNCAPRPSSWSPP